MKNVTPVFITTCSKNKVGLGSKYGHYANTRSPSSGLLDARARCYKQLSRSGGIYSKLKSAVQGPDFVADSGREGVYQPACTRYARGSFMTSLESDLGDLNIRLDTWLTSNMLFFISGLYGLVSSKEPIQNYDVEMDTEALDYWKKNKPLLTKSLLDQLPQDSIVLDCCGDRRYSRVIDWEMIKGAGKAVFHAVDPYREGAQIRSEAASFAALIEEDSLRKLTKDGELQAAEGDNACIRFISTEEFERQTFEGNSSLPIVGIIDIKDEYDQVKKYAERQGWDRHFVFERLSTRDKLVNRLLNGGQCILLCPSFHKDSEGWYEGPLPSKVMRIQKLAELSLQLIHR